MVTLSAALVIRCRMALRLTQEDFGNILGVTKRTVQRWEERGALLIDSQIEALARAVYPAEPDLAAEVAAARGTTLDRLGVVPSADGTTTPNARDAIDSIVRAAAEAVGLASEAIRPAVAAAFLRAGEVGLDVKSVVDGLASRDET